jgi:hypothetical protein
MYYNLYINDWPFFCVFAIIGQKQSFIGSSILQTAHLREKCKPLRKRSMIRFQFLYQVLFLSPTNIMHASDILKLNNRGVEMLRLGKLSNAEQLFRQCLLGSLTEFIPCNQISHHPFCSAYSTQASFIPLEQQIGHEEDYFGSNIIPHTQGFCLDETVLAIYDDAVATQSIISAIFIYNLGVVDLCFTFGQLTSSDTPKLTPPRREQLLCRALCLFEKAIFILERTGIASVTNVAIADFFMVALYNNVGCILVETRQYAAAKVAFGKVIRMAVALQRFLSSEEEKNLATMECMKSHLESFTLNALLHQEPCSAAAA